MICSDSNSTAFKKLMILIFISGVFLSKKKPFINSPSSSTQGKDKKPKYSENDDDYDDYEPTGMLSDFKREAGIMSDVDKSVSKSMIKRPENSYMQQSLVASFMEQEENLSLLGNF